MTSAPTAPSHVCAKQPAPSTMKTPMETTSALGRRALGPLAATTLFCTVLASNPVYAFAPPAAPAPAAETPTKMPAAKRSAADATKRADSPRSARTAKPAKTDSDGPKRKGGRKSIAIDDDFLIEGKLDKPNAFLILRRSSVDFDWARLDATFSPLVLESVQDPLF